MDEKDGEAHPIPKVEAKEGYEFTGWHVTGANEADWLPESKSFYVTGLAFYQEGKNDGYVTFEATFKEKEAVAEKDDAVLRVHYVDVNSDNYIKNNIQTIKKNGKVGEKAEFNEEDLVLPEGYELAEENWSASVEYGKDDDVNVSVKKVSEERNVIVTIQAGEGTFVKEKADDSKKTRVYKTTEFSGNSIQLPTVEAPEGYEFVGWTVNSNGLTSLPADAKTLGTCGLGCFPEGSDEGYISLEALYVKKDEEQKTAHIKFEILAADEDKGEFAAETDQKEFNVSENDETQYSIPGVVAKEGYKFTGWKSNVDSNLKWDADAKTFGVLGLAYYNGDSADGYVTLYPTFEKVEEPAVKRTVNAYFNIDPEKGAFTEYGDSTVISFENIDEFSDQQFEVPAVTAKEGYVFTGWKVEGAGDAGHWDADAKTFGLTGLAHFPEGSNVGYVTITAEFKETPVDPDKPVVDPTNPDKPSKDDTKPAEDNKTTDDKKSEDTKKTTDTKKSEDTKKTTDTKKKSAKKADEKKSETVQTGDHSNVFVYVATLLVAGAAAVVAFFRRRNA